MRVFTEQELAKHNGRNGTQAYVAFDGRIYDVTGSFLWQDGSHQVLHQAGTDLTQALAEAPHGADLLQKFPVVGLLGTP
jgi:predicted heme/steroid binding protein